MKLVLEQLAKMKSEGLQSRDAEPAPGQATNLSQTARQVLPWKGLSRPEPLQPAPEAQNFPNEIPPAPAPAPKPITQPAPQDQAPQTPRPEKRRTVASEKKLAPGAFSPPNQTTSASHSVSQSPGYPRSSLPGAHPFLTAFATSARPASTSSLRSAGTPAPSFESL